MEPQQHQQQPPHEDSSSSSSSKSSFLCRQPSTRWIPTTDQIRILRDLYYNNGVRSPSSEQIQRISARLRQYGKIEGKNVFYWFQNHKARERQKKRFTVDIAMQNMSNKYTNMTTGVSSSSSCPSSSSSSGVLSVSQMGGIGCGSLLMEKSFRDCSISAGGGIGTIGNNIGWLGVEQPYSSPQSRFDQIKPTETLGEPSDTETLQLFPMHGEDTVDFSSGKQDPNLFFPGWYSDDDDKGGCGTSLELSLNSYAGDTPDSTC